MDTNNIPIYNQIKYILSTFFVDFIDTNINITQLFLLLNVDRIKNPKIIKKNRYQKKVLWPGIENLIYSANYKGIVKGIITNYNKKFLKNGICLYITSKKKNVHIKILKSSLGISGADDEETVHEVTEYIKDRILKIENILKLIKSDINKTTLDWVLKKTKGPSIRVISGTQLQKVHSYEKIIKIETSGKYVVTSLNDSHIVIKIVTIENLDQLNVYWSELLKHNSQIFLDYKKEFNPRKFSDSINISDQEIEEFLKLFIDRVQNFESLNFVSGTLETAPNGNIKIVNTPGEYIIDNGFLCSTNMVDSVIVPSEYINNNYPAHTNKVIARFLISKIFDYPIHEPYSYILNCIYNVDSIVRGDMMYNNVKVSMIFTNFNLGFNVNLEQLYIHGDGENFIIIQDDDNTGFVKIQSPYIIPEELKDQIKTNSRRPNVHTFLIYKNGRITQSGPHQTLNRSIHCKFVKYIYSIRDIIERI